MVIWKFLKMKTISQIIMTNTKTMMIIVWKIVIIGWEYFLIVLDSVMIVWEIAIIVWKQIIIWEIIIIVRIGKYKVSQKFVNYNCLL